MSDGHCGSTRRVAESVRTTLTQESSLDTASEGAGEPLPRHTGAKVPWGAPRWDGRARAPHLTAPAETRIRQEALQGGLALSSHFLSPFLPSLRTAAPGRSPPAAQHSPAGCRCPRPLSASPTAPAPGTATAHCTHAPGDPWPVSGPEVPPHPGLLRQCRSEPETRAASRAAGAARDTTRGQPNVTRGGHQQGNWWHVVFTVEGSQTVGGEDWPWPLVPCMSA